ncbi:hypothetical protein [Streptomyces xanthophaeus]|uniref:hypothetical protein n=1 Tax=Streptomyces xanthophaeus TaxID=67385 RepID=UPI002647A044|nr:hypothetical protein [Streptomyces xanthophaeus]WKD31485.1 hypothetical protein KO717_05640 [Streptomyces xanthophaeus]
MPRTRLRPATAVAALAAGIIALLPFAVGGAHGTTPATATATATTATGVTTSPGNNAQWG